MERVAGCKRMMECGRTKEEMKWGGGWSKRGKEAKWMAKVKVEMSGGGGGL